MQEKEIKIIFTAKEILEQIHRELVRLGASITNPPEEEWLKYIIARAVEDVLLIDLTPPVNGGMEMTAAIVRSNYRRQDGDQSLTLQQDVGSKLFPYLSSCDLPFESRLELHRNCVIIEPRKGSF